MTPEQLYELNQSEKPRQYAMAILKMKAHERADALLLVPEHLRGITQDHINNALEKQRWRNRRLGNGKA